MVTGEIVFSGSSCDGDCPYEYSINHCFGDDCPKTRKSEKETVKAEVDWKKKDTILYLLARLVRNTDGMHPSTWGTECGKLLVQLRQLDGERYDREVIGIKGE